MKHGGVLAWLHAFLILPVNVEHVVESHPLHHTTGKKYSIILWIGSWVGLGEDQNGAICKVIPGPPTPWGHIGEIEVQLHSFYLDTMWRCTQFRAPVNLRWERNTIPIKLEVWWVPELVWTIRRRKRYLLHDRIRTLGGPARSPSHYTACAMPALCIKYIDFVLYYCHRQKDYELNVIN
jgi:hypothetical protein